MFFYYVWQSLKIGLKIKALVYHQEDLLTLKNELFYRIIWCYRQLWITTQFIHEENIIDSNCTILPVFFYHKQPGIIIHLPLILRASKRVH